MSKSLLLIFISAFLYIQAFAQDSLKNVSFFTELTGSELDKIASDTSIIKNLKQLKASLRIAIIDMSPERVSALTKLQNAQIPIHAWLMLSKEDGFWANNENYKTFQKRYSVFADWSAKEGIKWKSVGLTILPQRSDASFLLESQKSLSGKWDFSKIMIARLLDWDGEFDEAKAAYEDLVRTIKSDGYAVEVYQSTMQMDEVLAETSSFQKMAGIINVKGDEQFTIIHRRLTGDYPNILAFIDAYGKSSDGIVLGHTASQRPLNFRENDVILNWQELSRSLTYAQQERITIHISTLEGCIEQGILPKMRDLVITKSNVDITEEKKIVDARRTHTVWLFQVLSYPYLLIAAAIIFGILIITLLIKIILWIFR
jgi:hypothetical protein